MLPDFLEIPLQAVMNMRRLGGPVVVWIFVACVLMWTIVLERAWYLRKVHPVATAEQESVWRQRTERTSWASRASTRKS
jgi:biopolymer transport protein ExbB